MGNDTETVELIVKLLRQTTSLPLVAEFLKSKNIPYSASSWDDMLAKRILPAVKGGTVNISELMILLRTLEEHGRHHVFLYRCDLDDIKEFMGENRIRPILVKHGLADLVASPKVLDEPRELTIVDVRWGEVEDLGNPYQFIIKIAETRESQKLIKHTLEQTIEGEFITKTWKKFDERAVNLFKLRSDGLLELRIASKSGELNGQSNKLNYMDEVNRMWDMVDGVLPRKSFSRIFLNTAKERLWKDRKSLTDRIRFARAKLKDEYGFELIAATGSKTSDLYDNRGIDVSIEAFRGHDAYCDSHNIWFKIGCGSSGNNEKEIHVILDGEPNEFVITLHCSLQDYEYVLSQLQQLNQ